MIKKNGLKILDFKSGKPRLSPEAFQRDLVDRILEISNQIHENTRRSSANWVVYTGSAGRDAIDEALDNHFRESFLDSTTTVDGVEGHMRLLGVDTVGDNPNHLSMRYAFQPSRTLEYVNLDFSITPTGENISFSG